MGNNLTLPTLPNGVFDKIKESAINPRPIAYSPTSITFHHRIPPKEARKNINDNFDLLDVTTPTFGQRVEQTKKDIKSYIETNHSLINPQSARRETNLKLKNLNQDFTDYKLILTNLDSIKKATTDKKALSFKPGEDLATVNKICNLEFISQENKDNLLTEYKRSLIKYFNENPLKEYNPASFGVFFNIFPATAYRSIKKNFRTNEEGLQFLINHQNLLDEQSFFKALTSDWSLAQVYFNKFNLKNVRIDQALRKISQSFLFPTSMGDDNSFKGTWFDITFVKNYVNQNNGGQHDINYAMKMLNSIVDLSQNAEKKLPLPSKDDFVNQCLKFEEGNYNFTLPTLSKESLETIYDEITTNPIQFNFQKFVGLPYKNSQPELRLTRKQITSKSF